MGNADIARNGLAAWEKNDSAALANSLADDFSLTGVTPQPLTKQHFLAFHQVHIAAFPDWKFNIHSLEEQGNQVRISYAISGTHQGTYDLSLLGMPIPPIPATGGYRQWPPESMVFTIENGIIKGIEVSSNPDGGGIPGTLAWLGVKMPDQA